MGVSETSGVSERRVFDAHCHIIDPRFPLQTNQGYRPPPFDCDRYLEAVAPLGVVGGAVVSGSFQGLDQSYLRAALATLGPTFVGVTQLDPSVSDAALRELDVAGVRALRFNLRRGEATNPGLLRDFAGRVAELVGWHVEVYAGSRDLERLMPVLEELPAVVVDHLGLEARSLPTLRRLVASGARVKVTGLGRFEGDPTPVLAALAEDRIESLLFGTDLPSTRARRPFCPEDLDLLLDVVGPNAAEMVLWQNAQDLYRPSHRTP